MNKKIWVAGVLAATLVTCQISRQSGSKNDMLRTTDASVSAIPAFTDNPSPAHLTPEQSIKTFKLPKGYHLELVVSEPMTHEPVAIAWDGNARMYVAELNTYMQDVEGTDEHAPTSRVMLLEDTDNDGKMDKSSVFIDKMLLPRMLLCVGNELLVNETDTYNVYGYKDNNKDGVADEKRPVYTPDKKAPGNLEHQRSGLDWNVDNWIYMAVDAVRFRYTDGVLKADSIPSGSNGQWGLTHDNYGRLYFSSAGGETPVLGFQINPVYGRMEFADQYKEEFNEVWPIIKTPDVEGGLKRLRADTTLNHFTASCGQVIFRGDKLPADLQGDLLISEPVGRLIRRAKVINKNGKITLENAYDKEEFIASTDMNFRAVNMYTGPDGCLYIVDMNRGIIQEGNWTGPKSYLRPQIKRLGLDKNIQHGRIYRLVHDGMAPGPKPKMLDETSRKLVSYLGHPNGWWRDNAQKELVVRNDQSVVPLLKAIAAGESNEAIKSPSALARLHALWTLEGLNALDQNTIARALKDSDFEIRKAAVRMTEPYLKKNDAMVETLAALKSDPVADVRMQLIFSLAYSESPKAKALAGEIVRNANGAEVLARAQRSVEKNEDAKKFGMKLGRLDVPDRTLVMNGSVIYKSLCATCHGADGKGLTSKTAPPLAGSRRLNRNNTHASVRILLHGLSGPIEGNTYPTEMPSMKDNDDEWIASVLSYVRYEFTNSPPVRPADVKTIREQTVSRDKAYTLDELSIQ
ncbi:mono/diheme cytochrome c family protein/glucose/arabinose dehydrogenase [Dyadobacter sp. BE34]|uniref:Mono/diheme cytochrome c family protein/glucose/arabinose dehydrogenase n=1 Tax=Dyadobacter fermentans TaxID=94254 RepID=A0ABU1QTA5_9BACT|nr:MULTISPECIES: c-type cytochrome [Dyadobacter]MDR6804391.1 mono/diheme cytochrome c family protein/glucose/arabinose dehydrogenase [Dyadobacter fermentans]MDR7042131.1 mono/diheme cytochrome c family protein/glucose/arabinose dehydrogenase [Dyadobacter sp. BE242]MDR7196534.1 mono/diheme cytochrome c family protein/glucose/arabinose dehydrogenase [Dyadobacter sp. BE34]MDR7212921.1 mono/diheme cytochrome c family protein/glucose/arabinose dehydrogenase [Dyadobacter sp. BE31]MDR7261940.1 mono/d